MPDTIIFTNMYMPKVSTDLQIEHNPHKQFLNVHVKYKTYYYSVW